MSVSGKSRKVEGKKKGREGSTSKPDTRDLGSTHHKMKGQIQFFSLYSYRKVKLSHAHTLFFLTLPNTLPECMWASWSRAKAVRVAYHRNSHIFFAVASQFRSPREHQIIVVLSFKTMILSRKLHLLRTARVKLTA